MKTFELHVFGVDLPRFMAKYRHIEDPIALWRRILGDMFGSASGTFSIKCALVGDAVLGVVETDKGGRSLRKRIRATMPLLKNGSYRLLELDPKSERMVDVLEEVGKNVVVIAWGRWLPRRERAAPSTVQPRID